MDPNANITHMRALAEQAESNVSEPVLASLALEMADLFGALDEWLSKGGFTPQAWGGDDET